jgi:hypothetical protein
VNSTKAIPGILKIRRSTQSNQRRPKKLQIKRAPLTWSIELASLFRYPQNYGQPDRKEGC